MVFVPSRTRAPSFQSYLCRTSRGRKTGSQLNTQPGSILLSVWDIRIISEKWKWNFKCMPVFQKFASVCSCQWKWKDVCFALEKISSEIQTENVTCGHIWDGRHGYALQNLPHWSQPDYQCKKRLNAAWTPEFHPLPFPLHAGNHHGFLHWVGLDVYPLLNACDLPGVLDWVELDFHLLLHAGDHHVLCYELDFVFNLFCLQVTSMAFWRDLFFTLFCMQVTIMTFWIE